MDHRKYREGHKHRQGTRREYRGGPKRPCDGGEKKEDKKEREISLDITPEDYEEGFKKWPEMTATSPSGRHLGLYKALLNNEELSGFFSGMCELPVKYGFAPKRWAHALKLMLEKDQGKPRVSRLRVIHLLEADYNFVLRTMWGQKTSMEGKRQQSLHGSATGATRKTGSRGHFE